MGQNGPTLDPLYFRFTEWQEWNQLPSAQYLDASYTNLGAHMSCGQVFGTSDGAVLVAFDECVFGESVVGKTAVECVRPFPWLGWYAESFEKLLSFFVLIWIRKPCCGRRLWISFDGGDSAIENGGNVLYGTELLCRVRRAFFFLIECEADQRLETVSASDTAGRSRCTQNAQKLVVKGQGRNSECEYSDGGWCVPAG